MPSKLQLEAFLARANEELLHVRREAEVLGHALNLYINECVHWKYTFPTSPEPGKHEFGFAVVMHVGEKNENIPVVFWRRRWESGHQYMTALEADKFKRLPERLREEGSELAEVVESVLAQGVDHIFEQIIATNEKVKSNREMHARKKLQ